MKHSFFLSLTRERNTGVVAFLHSPMSMIGMATLVIASAEPQDICTASLISTERKTEQQEIKENCAKVLPASFTFATSVSLTSTLWLPSLQAKTCFLRSVLTSSAHWLQYRKFSVITQDLYMYRWDVVIC